MMEKDFKRWHEKKSLINKIEERPFFHERDIWFCHVGVNVGFEQDGSGKDFQRPVVIVRKFNAEIAWIIPLSTTNKRSEFYFPFQFDPKVVSVATMSQIKLLDAKRLSRRIGRMRNDQFRDLINKIKALLP